MVPLSEPARDLLRELLPGNSTELKRITSDTLVLPGAASKPFSGWSKSKSALDGAVAGAHGASLAPWSVHDLRRTVATGLQRLGVRLEVTEAVLNHISGSRAGIAGVYQRHDWAAEKRAALDAWAAYVIAAAEGRSATGNVVTLGRAG